MAAVTSTGNSVGQVDLLDKFEAFIDGTKGWTVNDYSVNGSGKKLHIQKSLTSSTVYMNIRAMVSEKLPGQGSTTNPLQYLSGLCSYLSSSYDSGTNFWDQTGGPPDYSGCPQGSYMNVSDDSASYRFVVDDDFFSISVADELGHYQHTVCTSVDGLVGCYANNTYVEVTNYGNAEYERRSFLRCTTNNADYWGNSLFSSSSLVRMLNPWGSGDGNDYINGIYSIGINSSIVGLVTTNLLSNSPSPSLGIPVLFPFVVFVHLNSTGGKYQYDGVDGIKILNKKYINDGDTITVGGIDYVVYTANYDLPDYGIAFKVS